MWKQDSSEGLALKFDAREFDPQDTGEIWIYRCPRCGRLNVFLQSRGTGFACERCGSALNAKPAVQ